MLFEGCTEEQVVLFPFICIQQYLSANETIQQTMTNQIQESLWRQSGAAIDMLVNVISACPDDYFTTHKRFYYVAYHTAVLLDYYLTIPPKDFSPLLPFTVKEASERPAESVGDMIPDRIYSRQELVDYIKASRLKCKQLIESLTDATWLNTRFTEEYEADNMDYSIPEILLYNLRHTQHHTGQLNLMMRQDMDKHMDWIFRAEDGTNKI